MIDKSYIETLQKRAKESKVYQKCQATGLALAEILDDKEHIALYIKLSKKYTERELIRIAKTIAEKRDVKNKGAYFMNMLKREGYFNKIIDDK